MVAFGVTESLALSPQLSAACSSIQGKGARRIRGRGGSGQEERLEDELGEKKDELDAAAPALRA